MRPSKYKKRIEQLKAEGKWVQKRKRNTTNIENNELEKVKESIGALLNEYIGARASPAIENTIKKKVNDILTSAWLRGVIAPSAVMSVNFDDNTGRCNVVIDAKIEPMGTYEEI